MNRNMPGDVKPSVFRMCFHLPFLLKLRNLMKKTILIIEDNRETAFVLREYFQDNGFDSEVAINGKEAVEKFYTGSFDIVLTDFKLPDIDGQTVITKFRQTQPDLKVLFLTAYNLSLRDSNTRVLEKPCRPQKILDAINKMLLS